MGSPGRTDMRTSVPCLSACKELQVHLPQPPRSVTLRSSWTGVPSQKAGDGTLRNPVPSSCGVHQVLTRPAVGVIGTMLYCTSPDRHCVCLTPLSHLIRTD